MPEKLIPLEENHELHGALLGLGVCVTLKVAGRPMDESLAVGALTGTIATALMKTFGHDIITQFNKKT